MKENLIHRQQMFSIWFCCLRFNITVTKKDKTKGTNFETLTAEVI